MKQLLVYGSLRRGQKAHKSLVNRECEFLKEVRVPGYDLYELGWYPGIVKNDDNKDGIVGELYAVPEDKYNDLIQHLDYYEGYFPDSEERSLFVRREIPVEGVPTVVYEYNGSKHVNDVIVPSGDWSTVNA